MLDRSVLRWGGMAAMVGAVIGLVFNVLHPRGDDYSAQGEVALVADSGIWLFDHFMLAWSLAFAFVGLVAIGWSFPESVAQSWGRIATATAIGGVTVGYITLGVDGMALGTVADQGGPVAEAVANIGLALFTGTIGSLFGLTPLLYGITGLSSDAYPRGFAYLALAGGAIGLLTASIQFLSGPSPTTVYMYVVASFLYTVWLFLMGWRLWSGATATAAAPTASTGVRA